jgi:hypothetical protein
VVWGVEKICSMKSAMKNFFNEINSENFFQAMNSALDFFFRIFCNKIRPENCIWGLQTFPKKINVQTTDQSVQKLCGLWFWDFWYFTVSI